MSRSESDDDDDDDDDATFVHKLYGTPLYPLMYTCNAIIDHVKRID